jgi:hypothetical protein
MGVLAHAQARTEESERGVREGGREGGREGAGGWG